MLDPQQTSNQQKTISDEEKTILECFEEWD